MEQAFRHLSVTVGAVLAMGACAAALFVYSGLYNIGADDHHSKLVSTVL